MLANLVIAGAPKCGTTSLYHHLADHPQMAASLRKETCYFMDPDYPLFREKSNYRDHGVAGYEEHFPPTLDPQVKWVYEATPDYLYQRTARDHLGDVNENMRVVFLLRHPADRAYSMFKFAQNNIGTISKGLSFSAFLDDIRQKPERYRSRKIVASLVEHGHYIDYLAGWFERHPNRVSVYLFEDLRDSPVQFMKQFACDFDIDPDYFESALLTKKNETIETRNRQLHRIYRKLRRQPWVRSPRLRQAGAGLYHWVNKKGSGAKDRIRPQASDEDRQALAQLAAEYAPGIHALESLLGRELTAWRQKYPAAPQVNL